MPRWMMFLFGAAITFAAMLVWCTLAHRTTTGGFAITGTGTTLHAGWTVTVDPADGRHTLARGKSSVSPIWPMKSGWLVLLEDEARAWSFNGDDQLAVFVYSEPDRWNIHAADQTIAPVPPEIVRHIGEQRLAALAALARESRERLGLAPAR